MNRPADFAAVDPVAVMRIKDLQLRAKTIVEGFYHGLHRSPFHGFSAEFSEYRPYTAGDDLRRLDWKLLARSDRHYIKQFEDETNRRCYLVLDQSRSMGYGSLPFRKIDYAQTLCATIAYHLTEQRDTVGLLTFDQELGDFIPARSRAGHFRRLLVGLSRPLQGTGTDLAVPLQQIAALVRRRGLILLVSDVLASIETLQTNLALLRSRGHEVLVLRTLDPAEIELQISGPSMVTDAETGLEIYVDPESARPDYAKRFEEHRKQLQTVCDSLGVDIHEMQTDQPFDEALFQVIRSQRERRSTGNRAGMIGRSRRHSGGSA